jgi:DNA-binding response OmpR family regulator
VKALVVDDDLALADLLAFTLRREGFEVVQAQDGETALSRWKSERPDLVVLDVNLPPPGSAPLPRPALDGFEVCRRIREQGDTPIILLTVRESEDDIVRGLQIGADDYIVKPFSPRQLAARIWAVLRRAGRAPAESTRQVGDLLIDLDRRAVQTPNGTVQLTALESRLLDALSLYPGRVFTYAEIIDAVWGPEGADRDMLRQLVRRLRAKIEPDPGNPVYVETIAGLGYGIKREA